MATIPNNQSSPPLEPPGLFDRLRAALLEDFGLSGDVTSQALITEGRQAKAEFVAKAEGLLCGVKLLPLIFQMAEQLVSLEAAGRAWELHDAQDAALSGKARWDDVVSMHAQHSERAVRVVTLKKDGEPLLKGNVIATVEGNARALLVGERVALNLLSHLSGIATQTHTYARKISHTSAKVLDTRKTTPLWRDLEKYAVKCGGGENHRRGLYDMVLIKDNHLSLWGAHDPAGAVRAAKAKFPQLPLEVEVTDLAGLQNACTSSEPDFVLLDNFSVEQLRDAVAWTKKYFSSAEQKNKRAPKLEASGGVTLETLAAIAETGVDRISVGALTHSVKALDISLEFKNF